MERTEKRAESVREYIARKKEEEEDKFEEEAYHKAQTLAGVEERFKESQREMLNEMISDAERLDKAEEKKWSHMKEKHFYRIETMLDAYMIIFGYHEHRDITNTDDLDYAGLDPKAAKKIMEGLK